MPLVPLLVALLTPRAGAQPEVTARGYRPLGFSLGARAGVPAGLGFEVGARVGPIVAFAGGAPDLGYFAGWWRAGLQSPPWHPQAFDPGRELSFAVDGGRSSGTIGLVIPLEGHTGWSTAADVRYRAWAHPHWGSGVDLSLGVTRWTSAWISDAAHDYRAPLWRPLVEAAFVIEAR